MLDGTGSKQNKAFFKRAANHGGAVLGSLVTLLSKQKTHVRTFARQTKSFQKLAAIQGRADSGNKSKKKLSDNLKKI